MLALVAAGGLWRVARTPSSAMAPWSLDGPPPADVRLDAFRHAILAPNPHNRQPWLIRLDDANEATIFCDLDRRLPATDPHDRQITIGFGCFLETARLAATRRGTSMRINPFPEGEPEPRLDGRPVAQLSFLSDGTSPDPLASAIPVRRSDKGVYADTPVEAAQLNRIARPVGSAKMGATADPAMLAHLRSLILEAIDIELKTPAAHQESVELMRIGAHEIDAMPDGIALAGPMIEALSAIGQITRDSLADPGSSAFRQTEVLLQRTYGSVPALVWVTTPGNSRIEQLAAGAAYVRANLAATSLGLSMHPMSQALQEYPELAGVFGRLHARLAPPGERVQMLARVGHGQTPGPSPRWPLETRLVAPVG